VSKFVAKFRKDRDYSDDYNFSANKKRGHRNDPTKKLINYNYDEYLSDYDNYEDENYTNSSKKKLKQFN